MGSLVMRLSLTLALLGGGMIAAKTLSELGQAEAPVTAQAEATARTALLAAAPRIERAYATGRAEAPRAALEPLAKAPGAREIAVVEATGALIAATPGLAGATASDTPLAKAFELVGAPGDDDLRLAMEGSSLYAALPIRLEHGAPDPDLTGPPPPAPGTGFALARFDHSAALAAARGRVLRANGLLAAGLLLLLVAAGAVAQLSLGRPVRRIAKAIERFDLGERAARTGTRRGELGRIGRAFDTMAERLKQHEEELLETRNRLELVLRCLPVGVMVVRRDDGRPIYVNPRWKELFGIPMDATRDILSLLSTVRCERPDGSPYPLEQLPIPTALRSGKPAEVRDLRVRRDDQVVSLVAGAVPVSLWRTDTFDAVVAMVEQPGSRVVPETAPEGDATAWPSEARTPKEARAAEPAEPGEVTAFPVGRSEPVTVMVVEGETELRELAERTLAQAGYRVLATGNGAEAMTFVRGEGPQLRAVVLDLWVPGSGGGMLLDELLAVEPAARVVAASGYRPDMPELASSGKVVAFLPKPYGADRLLAAVREVEEKSLAEETVGR
jgi:CheY-like chemotaxis protein/HAMP domain-containing protein